MLVRGPRSGRSERSALVLFRTIVLRLRHKTRLRSTAELKRFMPDISVRFSAICGISFINVKLLSQNLSNIDHFDQF